MSQELKDLKRWLAFYGYLETPDIDNSLVPDAIRRLQLAYGQKQTGEFNATTKALIAIPRCGNPDTFPVKEWLLAKQGSTAYKWDNPIGLKYHNDYASLAAVDLPKPDIQFIIRDSFSAWSAVSKITFIEAGSVNEADIRISCGSGRRDEFDGPGNILAWAEIPVNGRGPLQCKFDADEPWVGKKQARGVRFGATATHEFGHLIGLTHSRVNTALMAPVYNEAIQTPQEKDDIPRAVWRYGEPDASIPGPVDPPVPTEPPTTPTPTPIPPGSPPGNVPRIKKFRVSYDGINFSEYNVV